MTKYLWEVQERQQITRASNRLAKKITALEEKLEKQLQDNPLFQKIAELKKKDKYEQVNFTSSRIRELTEKYTPKELLSTIISAREDPSRYVLCKTIDYIDKNQQSSGIYSLYEKSMLSDRLVLSVNGFKLSKGEEISKLNDFILDCSKKGHFFNFDYIPNFKKIPLFNAFYTSACSPSFSNSYETISRLIGEQRT